MRAFHQRRLRRNARRRRPRTRISSSRPHLSHICQQILHLLCDITNICLLKGRTAAHLPAEPEPLTSSMPRRMDLYDGAPPAPSHVSLKPSSAAMASLARCSCHAVSLGGRLNAVTLLPCWFSRADLNLITRSRRDAQAAYRGAAQLLKYASALLSFSGALLTRSAVSPRAGGRKRQIITPLPSSSARHGVCCRSNYER